MEGISRSELAALLLETSRLHHDAYEDVDGYDPEWPKWYAGHLVSELEGRSSELPDVSQLEGLLMEADREFKAEGLPYDEWPDFYAGRFLAIIWGLRSSGGHRDDRSGGIEA